MTERRIPFYRASLRGRELDYVAQAAESGQTGGAGPFGDRCEKLLEEALGAPRVLLTTSGTHALEMAALLLRLKPHDQVIVPAFSFATTAGAFHQHGGHPVFVDIDPHTLGLDPQRASDAIGEHTTALVPVHYGGGACAIGELLSLASENGLSVVEDNAHGLFGSSAGRPLGTFGSLAALSFQQTKNFIAGEGGALVINDRALIERAETIREKGTNRSAFMRGQADRYDWVDVGSSYVLSDLLAAFLLAQLEDRDAVQNERKTLWEQYQQALAPWAKSHGVGLPKIAKGCEPAWHMYWLLMPNRRSRDGLIDALASGGIHAVFHYMPLHLSPMGRRLGGKPGDCPVTEKVADTIVRLPFFNGMTAEVFAEIVETVTAFKA